MFIHYAYAFNKIIIIGYFLRITKNSTLSANNKTFYDYYERITYNITYKKTKSNQTEGMGVELPSLLHLDWLKAQKNKQKKTTTANTKPQEDNKLINYFVYLWPVCLPAFSLSISLSLHSPRTSVQYSTANLQPPLRMDLFFYKSSL
jgi:hypothetical protein